MVAALPTVYRCYNHRDNIVADFKDIGTLMSRAVVGTINKVKQTAAIPGMANVDIQVFLQPVNGSGFRAETSPPWNVTAQGATREEALDGIRDQIRAKLADGSEIVSVFFDEPENPWLKLAGVHKNDPHYHDYLNAVADYRQQVELDADRP